MDDGVATLGINIISANMMVDHSLNKISKYLFFWSCVELHYRLTFSVPGLGSFYYLVYYSGSCVRAVSEANDRVQPVVLIALGLSNSD